jgi:hypothetical protein
MKRFALLIEASQVPGEQDLPGARADMETFQSWLISNPGGFWHSTEYQILRTPTVAEVKKALERIGKIDYGFIVFAGHGFHSKELDKTKVCLKDGGLLAHELRPNADRCTLVIDACRNVVSEIPLMESIQLSYAEVRKYAAFARTRDFRQEFETKIGACEKGFIYLYSCDLNESAADSPRGGLFSRCLVASGVGFAENNSDAKKWLSTREAFGSASSATTSHTPTQHPKYEPGRRLGHFPFAI